MPVLTLYTRRGCHLCADAEALLERLDGDLTFELTLVDVDTDSALAARYGWDVPVLHVNHLPAFAHRIDEAALRQRLALDPRGAGRDAASPERDHS